MARKKAKKKVSRFKKKAKKKKVRRKKKKPAKYIPPGPARLAAKKLRELERVAGELVGELEDNLDFISEDIDDLDDMARTGKITGPQWERARKFVSHRAVWLIDTIKEALELAEEGK